MCKKVEKHEVEKVASELSASSDEVTKLNSPVNYEERLKNFKPAPFTNKDSKTLSTLPPSNKIYTLYTYDMEFSADSVEWCPHEPHRNVFVCSNYYLRENPCNKNKHTRLGRIILFSISHDKGLTALQKVRTLGILDQKWCPIRIHEHILLGTVTSVGTLEIYRLYEKHRRLKLIRTYDVDSINRYMSTDYCIFLSLDWSVGKHKSSEPLIICSDSCGRIHQLKLTKNDLILLKCWDGHQFEAWIAAFYYWDPNVFFSGGDDSILLKFDTRASTNPVAKNKSHQAGVTCLHSNSKKEFCLVSGSYDSRLRIWDVRYMKCPTDEVEMPGTLWRVKWDPFEKNLILAACMQGGVHVVNTIDEDYKIIESYYKHNSLAYGADWCHLKDGELEKFNFAGNRIIATCSFYDNLLCVSRACLCPYCFCYDGCSHAIG